VELHGWSVGLSRRNDRLVPIAEFATTAAADAAWVRLEEAGIPASVVTEPPVLGGPGVTRVYVAAARAQEAQRLLTDLIE
jgi:hypothetical protein